MPSRHSPKRVERPDGPMLALKPCPCSVEETIHKAAYSTAHGDNIWKCLGMDGESPCGRYKTPYSRARALLQDEIEGVIERVNAKKRGPVDPLAHAARRLAP